MFAVIRYPHSIEPNEAQFAEWSDVNIVLHRTRAGAQAALRGMLSDPSREADSLTYAGLRVEACGEHFAAQIRE